MRKLFKIMSEKLSGGEDLCLVTVIASSGSTPRGAGSRMLVGRQGRIYGTIGGGNVEHRSREIAQKVIEEKNSMSHDFSLTRNDVENLGMICGGAVNVYFRYIPAGDAHALEICAAAEELFDANRNIWLIEGETMELSATDPGKVEGAFCEQINRAGSVYIFGCGHVGQALVPVLQSVGFKCVAMDDREEFARKNLFPEGTDVRLIDFENIDKYVTITESDYVCVMTRGHAYDAVVQAQVLKTDACYIGVIGSKAKKAGVYAKLKEEYGFEDSVFERITSPIGLSIKAETPAEIAISICAQMIQLRAELNGK